MAGKPRKPYKTEQQRKKVNLLVRVSEPQLELFKEAAELEGKTLSKWVREHLLQIARAQTGLDD